jgi:hypothetical protein
MDAHIHNAGQQTNTPTHKYTPQTQRVPAPKHLTFGQHGTPMQKRASRAPRPTNPHQGCPPPSAAPLPPPGATVGGCSTTSWTLAPSSGVLEELDQ